MTKKTEKKDKVIKKVKRVTEVEREMIDRDHIKIIYSDKSEQIIFV